MTATKAVTESLQLLGHEVEDKVGGAKGVVVSMTFDLYGCIQALVRLPFDKKAGKEGEVFWFDTKRLTVLSKKPVMNQPDFVAVPGGEAKPFPH